MKKYIVILLVLVSSVVVGQVTPRFSLTVATKTTTFGVNLPLGTIVFDDGGDSLYLLTAPAASSSSLATATKILIYPSVEEGDTAAHLTDGFGIQDFDYNQMLDAVVSVDTNEIATVNYVTNITTQHVYDPDASVITNGTQDAGTVDSCDYHDGKRWSIGEVTGSPGINVTAIYDSVDQVPVRLTFHGNYEGSPLHDIAIQMWNYTDNAWETYHTLDSRTTMEWVEITISDPVEHVRNDSCKVRFYHSTSGNSSHELYVDYLVLSTMGFGSTSDHGELVGLADDDHTQYALLDGRTGDELKIDSIESMNGYTYLDGTLSIWDEEVNYGALFFDSVGYTRSGLIGSSNALIYIAGGQGHWFYPLSLNETPYIMNSTYFGNYGEGAYDLGAPETPWHKFYSTKITDNGTNIKLNVPNGSSPDSVLAIESGNVVKSYVNIPSIQDTSLWNRSNGDLYPKTITDSVGIGISTPSEMLEVNGNIEIPATSATVGSIKEDGVRVYHRKGGNLVWGIGTSFTNLAGTNNVVYGNYAGFSINSGSKNVVVGDSAGYTLNTATENVFVGYRAGRWVNRSVSTQGYYNVAIGTHALAGTSALAKPQKTVAIGQSALANISSGTQNVAVGYMAGNSTTTSSSNTFIGYLAGQFNTTGHSNVYVGAASGPPTGSSNASLNTFVGYGSGSWATADGQSTLIGYMAGQYSASDNVVIGQQAGRYGSGSSNVIIGSSAMSGGDASNNNIGNDNVVIGAYSMATPISQVDESGNIVIGKQIAPNGFYGGDYNTIIGGESLNAINDSTANNILIGTGRTYMADVNYMRNSIILGNFDGSSAAGIGAGDSVVNRFVIAGPIVDLDSTNTFMWGKLTSPAVTNYLRINADTRLDKIVYMPNITSTKTNKLLYWNSSTGKVTYGDTVAYASIVDTSLWEIYGVDTIRPKNYKYVSPRISSTAGRILMPTTKVYINGRDDPSYDDLGFWINSTDGLLFQDYTGYGGDKAFYSTNSAYYLGRSGNRWGRLYTTKITDNGSYVGINDDTPSYTLDVNGIINIDTSTSSSTGILKFGTLDMIHTYGSNQTSLGRNLWINGAGNFTNSGATYNIGVSYGALSSITSGDYNIALGTYAGQYSSGSNSMLIGTQAGQYAGSSSVYIGHVAGRYSTGTNNVAVGHGAMTGINDYYNSGGNNTVIGRNAFTAAGYYSAVVSETDNIVIGFLAATQGFGDGGDSNIVIANKFGEGISVTGTITKSSNNVILNTSGSGWTSIGSFNNNVVLGNFYANTGWGFSESHDSIVDKFIVGGYQNGVVADSSSVLLWGDFRKQKLRLNGDYEVSRSASITDDLSVGDTMFHTPYDLTFESASDKVMIWDADKDAYAKSSYTSIIGSDTCLWELIGDDIYNKGNKQVFAKGQVFDGAKNNPLITAKGTDYSLIRLDYPQSGYIDLFTYDDAGQSGFIVYDSAGNYPIYTRNGRVSINGGGVQPTYPLDVFGTAKISDTLYFRGFANSRIYTDGTADLNMNVQAGTNGTLRLRSYAGSYSVTLNNTSFSPESTLGLGNSTWRWANFYSTKITDDGTYVGINNVAPGYTLDVTGQINFDATTSSSTGIIRQGGNPLFHSYGSGTTYLRNMFFGESGNFTTSGGYGNIGINYGALASITSGDYNIAIGGYALSTITTPSSNIAIGHYSQKDVGATNQGYNVTIGSYSGQYQTYGYNVLIGVAAGRYVQGGHNIGIGYNALKSGAPGVYGNNQYNVAIGSYAHASSTALSENYNITIGTYAAGIGYNGGDSNLVIANNFGDNISYESSHNTVIISGGTAPSEWQEIDEWDNNVLLGNVNIGNGYQLTSTGKLRHKFGIGGYNYDGTDSDSTDFMLWGDFSGGYLYGYADLFLPTSDSVSTDYAMFFNKTTGEVTYANKSALSAGDNLGNHNATDTLEMNNYDIIGVKDYSGSTITTDSNITVGNDGNIYLGIYSGSVGDHGDSLIFPNSFDSALFIAPRIDIAFTPKLTLGNDVKVQRDLWVNGKTGLMTKSPLRTLDINSSTGSNLRLIYNDDDGSPTYYSDLLTYGTGKLKIDASGDTINFNDELVLSGLHLYPYASGGLDIGKDGMFFGTGWFNTALVVESSGNANLTLETSGSTSTPNITFYNSYTHDGWYNKLGSNGDLYWVNTNISPATALKLDVSAGDGSVDIDAGEVVINQAQSDAIDFRVESRDNTSMVFVDASSSEVGIYQGSPESRLDVNGSMALPIVKTTATSYTLDSDDYTLLVDNEALGTNRTTVNFPSASTCDGRIYVIKLFGINGSNYGMTLDAYGTTEYFYMVDGDSGVATINIDNNEGMSVTLQSLGGHWYVIDWSPARTGW